MGTNRCRALLRPTDEGVRPYVNFHPRRVQSTDFRPPDTPPFRNLTIRVGTEYLGIMAETTMLPRKTITAQSLDEARTAAYANDPQTELVIVGLSENAAVTTCGWAKRYFEQKPSGF